MEWGCSPVGLRSWRDRPCSRSLRAAGFPQGCARAGGASRRGFERSGTAHRPNAEPPCARPRVPPRAAELGERVASGKGSKLELGVENERQTRETSSKRSLGGKTDVWRLERAPSSSLALKTSARRVKRAPSGAWAARQTCGVWKGRQARAWRSKRARGLDGGGAPGRASPALSGPQRAQPKASTLLRGATDSAGGTRCTRAAVGVVGALGTRAAVGVVGALGTLVLPWASLARRRSRGVVSAAWFPRRGFRGVVSASAGVARFKALGVARFKALQRAGAGLCVGAS